MYDCDFESNMCGWRSESQQWVWERSSAASGSTNTGAGPEDDASGSKTGGFIHQWFILFIHTMEIAVWMPFLWCEMVYAAVVGRYANIDRLLWTLFECENLALKVVHCWNKDKQLKCTPKQSYLQNPHDGQAHSCCPTGRKLSFDFNLCYFSDGRANKFKFRLLLGFSQW